MRFISSFFDPKHDEPLPPLVARLAGQLVMLRSGELADWSAWRTLREQSHAFLKAWEPEWPSNGLNYSFFSGILRRQWREWRQGDAYSFLIFLRSDGSLIGGITLTDIQRSIAQKATLGYWIGQPYAGQGLMTEAASLVCDFAFGALKLNRVEASCLPNNEPSKRLLKRLDFVEEGYAKSYLRINGEWRDHLLWGKVKS